MTTRNKYGSFSFFAAALLLVPSQALFALISVLRRLRNIANPTALIALATAASAEDTKSKLILALLVCFLAILISAAEAEESENTSAHADLLCGLSGLVFLHLLVYFLVMGGHNSDEHVEEQEVEEHHEHHEVQRKYDLVAIGRQLAVVEVPSDNYEEMVER